MDLFNVTNKCSNSIRRLNSAILFSKPGFSNFGELLGVEVGNNRKISVPYLQTYGCKAKKNSRTWGVNITETAY